jgi:hypothetical protein
MGTVRQALAKRRAPSPKGDPSTGKKLEGGRIESLVRSLRSLSSPTPEMAELLRPTADYFAVNAPRMRYPTFRRQHLLVGSEVVEAGCKTLIDSRLKRSGMFWTVRAANSIIALRCHRLSGKFEDYWENRRVHAAGLSQICNAPSAVRLLGSPGATPRG